MNLKQWLKISLPDKQASPGIEKVLSFGSPFIVHCS
jgi:hypothetical protein